MIARGLRLMFSGLRRGNPALSGLGAAVAAAAWVRTRYRGEELLWSRTLRRGDAVRIRLLDTEDEIEIEG